MREQEHLERERVRLLSRRVVVKLIGLTDQTQPAEIAADAHQLIETDRVLGMAGNSDILECTIDHAHWEKLGVYVIGAGIAPECYSTPNIADVNMGPRFSSDGAVQYGLSQKPSKIVFVQSNVPGTGYIAAGPDAWPRPLRQRSPR